MATKYRIGELVDLLGGQTDEQDSFSLYVADNQVEGAEIWFNDHQFFFILEDLSAGSLSIDFEAFKALVQEFEESVMEGHQSENDSLPFIPQSQSAGIGIVFDFNEMFFIINGLSGEGFVINFNTVKIAIADAEAKIKKEMSLN